MLTNQAFNALLKTLEEPPEHVKFIFATTEPHKILATILSRCQRFDLRPIPIDIIARQLLHIAAEEKIHLEETAAWAIGKGADGGMRDAQSMLDQLVAFCGDTITEANVLDVFGFTSRETVAELSKALLERQTAAALHVVQREADAGRELSQLLGELIGCLRALLVSGLDSDSNAEGIPAEVWKVLTTAAAGYAPDRLLAVVDVFAETEGRMRWATNKRLHLELGLIKAIQVLGEVRVSDLIKVLGGVADHLPEPTERRLQPAPEPAPAKPEPEPEPTERRLQPASQPDPAPVRRLQPATEPEPEPEPAKPEPKQQRNLQPAPEPEPAKPEQKRPPGTEPKKPADPLSSIDDLIASAPEASEPPPPPAAGPVPEPESQKPAPEEDDFYKDPLIQKALTMFEAKIRA